MIPKTDNHNFGEWTVTKKATCEAEGEQTRTCSVCGKTETQSISKTDHDYEEQTEQKKVVDKEAYDEEVEYTVWWCGCGEEFDSVDALTEHQKEVLKSDDDDHPLNSGTKTKTKTVHHDEEFHYETVTKHVCKVCGHVKED